MHGASVCAGTGSMLMGMAIDLGCSAATRSEQCECDADKRKDDFHLDIFRDVKRLKGLAAEMPPTL